MFIVLVYVSVQPKDVDAFIHSTLENAKNSRLEPGVARFDVIQEKEDPTKFVLIEAYYTTEDAVKHKETSHYACWRDQVVDMMAEPRRSVKYSNVFPEENGW
jgi:(4S)-4-hydroxy-5-phosphonooxypentane-2,3-dione isomerase